MLVISENVREWEKDGRSGTMASITVVDQSPKGQPRLKESVAMDLVDEDHDLIGKLQDNIIEVDITEIRNGFKGRPPELRGRVVRQPAK